MFWGEYLFDIQFITNMQDKYQVILGLLYRLSG